MARTKSQFAESWEEASAPQDSQQAMQTHKVRKSRGVQTNRGLRRKTSSVHCAGKTGERLKGKDSPLRRTVAVVFLSVAPVHSVQGRFARRNGNRSRPCVYLAGMLSLPSVDQAQRKEVRLWEVRTQ